MPEYKCQNCGVIWFGWGNKGICQKCGGHLEPLNSTAKRIEKEKKNVNN